MNESQSNAETVPDAERLLAFLKRTGCEVEAELRGVSMETALPNGSKVRIRFGEAVQFALGSIVAFRWGPNLILHRLVYSDGTNLLTCGDGSFFPDPPLVPEMILGQVTRLCRDGDWIPPPTDSRSGGRRWLQSVFVACMLAALKVSPHFGRWLGRFMIEVRRIPNRGRRLLRLREKPVAEVKIDDYRL